MLRPRQLDGGDVIGHIKAPPRLEGDVSISDIASILLNNPLVRDRFAEVDGCHGIYRLARLATSVAVPCLPQNRTPADYQTSPLDGTSLVAFDRDTAQRSRDEVTLLTYGTPELEELLPPPAKASTE